MNKREEGNQLKEQFANDVLDSKRWLNSALDLLDAVKTLEPLVRARWHDFDEMKANVRSLMIHKTFMLLIGLSAENFLKSRIVKYNRPALRREILATGKLPSVIAGSHNLKTYARSARIKLTIEDEQVLSRLSRAIKWSGRYPVPSSYNGWDSDTYSGDDIDKLKRFLNELYGKLVPIGSTTTRLRGV